ncbi:energy transducer TonB [Hymenobacter busanensis]|uniref:Energy transducer TonB n=1 Tax=Hymenobacter busanensis TaxID=2607656 RepID=A0A7L4ZUD8_9BACT|nr:energy transducer TonB [Hymenobacter busanensis]KAA9339637.1 energy transducer TonB [Hymenobacter busanensis]QHJ06607.1 TonB family protein [Hymenobacter busanensis]
MKKTTFTLALALLAFAAAPALAQQKVKVKTKTETAGAPAPDVTPADAQTPVAGTGAGQAGAGTIGKTIAVAQYYEGGQEAMYAFIEKELKYPLMARRNRIQGTCIVSFTLNPDGTMSGVKLVKNIGGGCGEEALRVVKLLQFKKPDYPILTSLPVSFKLGAAGANTAQ